MDAFPLLVRRMRHCLAGRVAMLLLTITALALCSAGSQAQADDDQGWGQFSRENTLRGTVTALAPTGRDAGSLAVKTDAGQPWRVLYGVNTRIMRGREPVRASELQAGDMVFAAGDVDAKKKTVGAAVLIDVPAEEVRKAREGLGRTWSAGKITAIQGTRVDIQRLDGVPQSIAVDENTSFREKREPVTLADLHAGQGIRAEGHLSHGVFTAELVAVFDLNGHEPWLDAGSEAR